jgi:hypothetical protein
MRHLIYHTFLGVLAITVTLVAAENIRKDDRVYREIGHLRGQIIITNHPTLGRTPAAGHYLVFQRLDCKRCAIGTRSDLRGKYELFLSAGRYRVISTASVVEGEGPDLISPAQVREVEVKGPPDETIFDIELRIPSP